MLLLRRSLLTQIISSSSVSPVSQLHRLISAAAPRVYPNPSFAVEDYLIGTCGLTPAQALKASTKISHLKSPSNPDAVLAFLAGLGLSTAAVAKDPKLLCAKVEKTLPPVVVGLTSHGLSHTEISRIVSLAPNTFGCKLVVSSVQYFFGSTENLFRALKFNVGLLRSNLERTVKPNIALLRECGLGDCDIAKLSLAAPRILTNNLERFRAIVACAEGLGVPRGSGMFRHVLRAVSSLDEEKLAAKMEYLKKTFRWSDAEVRIAVCKAPNVLTRSKDILQGGSDFLTSEVGLEPAYIAHHSTILTFSLEGRLRPRHYVLKFLKENRLLGCKLSYCSAVSMSDKVFVEYICPHEQAAPQLAEDYASACRGKVPANFMFT